MDDLNGRVALVTGRVAPVSVAILPWHWLRQACKRRPSPTNKDKAGAEAVVSEIKEGGQQAVALTGDIARPDVAAATGA